MNRNKQKFYEAIVLATVISLMTLPIQASTIINCNKSIISLDKRDGRIRGRFDPASLEEKAKLTLVSGANALSAQYSVCIDTAGHPVKKWDVMLPRH